MLLSPLKSSLAAGRAIMMNIRAIGLSSAVLALGGCSLTEPVAVIGSNGEVMKGTATASSIGPSTFQVSNGRVSCTGTYDAITLSPTVSFIAKCSDGRTGIGQAIRDSDISGSGTISLSDGTTARFIFGPAAASL